MLPFTLSNLSTQLSARSSQFGIKTRWVNYSTSDDSNSSEWGDFKGKNLSGMSQVKQLALVKKEGRKLFKSTSSSLLLLFPTFQTKDQEESQAIPNRNEVRRATRADFPFSFTLNSHTHAPTPTLARHTTHFCCCFFRAAFNQRMLSN